MRVWQDSISKSLVALSFFVFMVTLCIILLNGVNTTVSYKYMLLNGLMEHIHVLEINT